VVRTYVGFCAGALRLPLMPFLAMTFIGSVAWCVPFIALGAILGSNWRVIQGPAKIVGLVVLGLLLTALIVITLREMRKPEDTAA
jgi:membrane protein DedA with SNARE-associated domain